MKTSEEDKEQLYSLLRAYGQSESIQSPDKALTDSEIKAVALKLEEFIGSRSDGGSVLDVGCGGGVLLQRLSFLPAFRDNSGWLYVGADVPLLHDNILALGSSLRLQRRVDVIDLDSLYSRWLAGLRAPLPLLVFCRNVLHELSIPQTAELLHAIQRNVSEEDLVVLQDLLVFPHAERGNVCWHPPSLHGLLKSVGFEVTLVSEPSKSGAQWLSVVAKREATQASLSHDRVLALVTEARMDQLALWSKTERLPLPHQDSRSDVLAILDFDLQRAALFNRLLEVGAISLSQRTPATTPSAKAAFSLALRSYNKASLSEGAVALPTIPNFRDRANSQDALEEFLTSSQAVAVIRGGKSCGKTVLVAHVLSRRAHGRVPVSLDCEAVESVWPLLESYLLGLGCSCAFEVLRSDRSCDFSELNNVLTEFIASIAQETIVVLDHFEHLLDPDGCVVDAEVASFLLVLASSPKAKVILTSRFDPQLGFLPTSVEIAPEQPPVGRFPHHGGHTENVLDDYVDRVSLEIAEYPADLLDAIDRFPYLATLAGKLIAGAGKGALEDPEILGLIRSYLYDELVTKIVTEEARNALDLAALLRIPSPRVLFCGIVGESATKAAEDTGLLYPVPDRHRSDLLSCAAVLRGSESAFESDEAARTDGGPRATIHEKIAKWYSMLTKDTEGDPRWVREAHYHTLASGNTATIQSFGRMYRGELFWAARTWCRRYRNYEAALEALLAAEGMGLQTYESRMLTASCLIRAGGHREEGEARYGALIRDYPGQVGVKTSFIDSLLKIKDYAGALANLEKFQLRIDGRNKWVTGQYGRAYLGLGRYADAVHAFQTQLRKYREAPAIVLIRLAQSHFRLGQRMEARAAVQQGLAVHPDDVVLNTLFCANLILQKTAPSLDEAHQRLYELLAADPRNGYVLQLLLKVCALRGNIAAPLRHLEEIGWQVEPAHLVKPVRITAAIAQGNWRTALAFVQEMDGDGEHAQALLLKTYLAWASAELEPSAKQRIAASGLKLPVPPGLEANVPILSMYAQLASIAGNNECFAGTLEKIRLVNPEAACELSKVVDASDTWDEYDSWDEFDTKIQ